MKRSRHRLASLLSVVLVLGVFAPARGGFITTLSVDVTDQGGGFSLFEYRLINDPASDLSVFQFSLDVAATADLTAISGPAGWDIIYSAGDTQVTWASSGSATDLLAGSEAHFSLISPLGPTLQPYLIAGINESIPQLDTSSGQIATPGAAVPEPSTLALLATGVALLGIGRMRRGWG